MSDLNLDAAGARPAVVAVIVAAMDAELAPFAARCSAVGAAVTVGQASLQLGTLEGHQVLLVRSGIGLVNGASAAVSALHRVDPLLVISVGSAGGLAGKVDVGQVVVGSEHTYSAADAVAFGYALGQVPGMPVRYAADASAVARASEIAGVVTGLCASSDTFVAGDRIDAVRAAFPEAVAVEMEATALAQVCHSFGVGFVSVRGISDLCGVEAAADHAQTVDAVSAASADVVLALLNRG